MHKNYLRVVCFAQALLIFYGPGSSAEIPAYERVRVLESPRVIEDIQLTDQNGEPFSLSQLRGRVALVFFGFTNCPDVCPMTMGQFRRFRESGNANPDEIAFVLVSVDGDRDTPEVMKSYLESFSPDFIGLTGEPAEVKVLSDQFSAAFFKRGSSDHDHYDVSHSPQSFVLDPEGMLRAEFYSPSIEAMAGVTAALLHEEQQR